MRGEYRTCWTVSSVASGSPPHARGILVDNLLHHSPKGITPACAGNTYPSYVATTCPRDHPRMRGEYRMKSLQNFLRLGSPPHARGIPPCDYSAVWYSGITPACAGNTLSFRPMPEVLRDHPRMRGEYLSFHFSSSFFSGSPPHARGILRISEKNINRPGITPACAGNTLNVSGLTTQDRDHPRMRGEYFQIPAGATAQVGSPPHARGIPGHVPVF